MRTALALVALLAGPAFAGDAISTEPGSFFNPYVATPRALGGYEIAPQIPDLANPSANFKPGGYNNPLVVRPVVPGSTTLQVAPAYPFPVIDLDD